ncbi:MAG: hypothetical protein EBR82_73530 [Caulobacteraceae bacterium]|nr:hypothetical protein [Caulobacteraceae bacterium]
MGLDFIGLQIALALPNTIVTTTFTSMLQLVFLAHFQRLDQMLVAALRGPLKGKTILRHVNM